MLNRIHVVQERLHYFIGISLRSTRDEDTSQPAGRVAIELNKSKDSILLKPIIVKEFFLMLCVFFFSNSLLEAQLTPPRPANKVIRKSQASPGLESAPTRIEAAPVITSANYYLSFVKVDIKTGADNKESLSNVSVELAVRDNRYSIFAQNNNTNEMRSNTTTPIGLEPATKFTSGSLSNAIPVTYSTTATGTQAVMLSDVEKYGLSLRIIYKPNFFADAWKIEDVTLTLEFKDAKQNLHPASGRKVISFANASTFLDNYDKRILVCLADGNFNPLTSYVTKDFGKRW